MKCPACKFACSELRDICPHCMLDLREHKKLHGIEIADPNTSYQELIKKASGNIQASSPNIKPGQESTTSNNKDFQKSTSGFLSEDLESLVKAAEEELGEESNNEISTTQEKSPLSDVDDLMNELMQESAQLKTKSIQNTDYVDKNSLGTQEISNDKLDQTESKDISKIEVLFKETFDSIKNIPRSNAAVEIGFSELAVETPKQELNLLFDIAYQTTKNPHILSTFNKELPSSKDVVLDSQKLTYTLEQVKKTLDTPVFSLKRKTPRTRVKDSLSYEYAPFRQRCMAAIIDILTCTFLALTFTFLIGKLLAASFFSGFSLPALPERHAIVGFFVSMMMLFGLLYPVCLLSCISCLASILIKCNFSLRLSLSLLSVSAKVCASKVSP